MKNQKSPESTLNEIQAHVKLQAVVDQVKWQLKHAEQLKREGRETKYAFQKLP